MGLIVGLDVGASEGVSVIFLIISMIPASVILMHLHRRTIATIVAPFIIYILKL